MLFSGLLALLVALRVVVFLHSLTQEADLCVSGIMRLDVHVNEVRTGAPLVLDVTVRYQPVHPPGCQSLIGERLRLSWYRPDWRDIEPGTVLRAVVKLKAPHGTKNPGGFDYERWLRGQGYVATGYVRKVQAVVPVDHAPASASVFAGKVHRGLLAALTLGRRSEVTAEQWQLLRATGTLHLVVVSGLHVGILGGLSFALAFGLLRLAPRRLFCSPWRQPRIWAGLASISVIGSYTILTGAAAPVVRAALMAGLSILALTCMRPLSWWRVYLLGLAFSILLNPAVVMQQGFYLSFIAVALLLWTFSPRVHVSSWIRGACMCQMILSTGLTPWVGWFVGEGPLVSVLANLIVVPPMTLVIIPLALLSVLVAQVPGLEAIGALMLTVPDMGLAVILATLERLSGLAPVHGPVLWVTAVAAFAGAVLLGLPGMGVRFGLGIVAWLPVLFPMRVFVPVGEVRIQILDVGQGSAALIDTADHRMIVDAGPRYRSGFDVGAAVVVPAVRYTGPDRSDLVLLSHWDNDHAGGLTAVTQRYSGAHVIAPGRGCVTGRTWHWDGVEFRLITDSQGASANDQSCTLLVTTRSHQVYFAGDIGRTTEARLLPELPHNIDLLIAPHHGSDTSSHAAFVAHIRPRFVVYSVGRDNRYGHPRESVMSRYRKFGAIQFTTAQSGALTWQSVSGNCVAQMRLAADCRPDQG